MGLFMNIHQQGLISYIWWQSVLLYLDIYIYNIYIYNIYIYIIHDMEYSIWFTCFSIRILAPDQWSPRLHSAPPWRPTTSSWIWRTPLSPSKPWRPRSTGEALVKSWRNSHGVPRGYRAAIAIQNPWKWWLHMTTMMTSPMDLDGFSRYIRAEWITAWYFPTRPCTCTGSVF